MGVRRVVERTTDVKTSMMELEDGTVFEIRSMPVANGKSKDMLFIKFTDGNQFQVLEHLGSGLYSHVLLAECCHSKQRYALKLVPALNTNDRYLQVENDCQEQKEICFKNDNQAQREILFHYCFYDYNQTNMQPPNVVHAHRYWLIDGLRKEEFLGLYKECIKVVIQKPDPIFRRIKDHSPINLTINVYFILMPYFPRGTLDSRIRENSLSDESRLDLFKDILTGGAFLHRKGLIHRRLRPSNILLFGQDGIHAAIAGFGRLISCGDNPEWYIPYTYGSLSRRNETDHYEAPEVKGTEYNQSCDYYSIGVIALQLLCNVPSEKLADTILHLQDNSKTGLPKDLVLSQAGQLWEPFMRNAVSRKKEARYSCEQLLYQMFSRRATIQRTVPMYSKHALEFDSFQHIMGAQSSYNYGIYAFNNLAEGPGHTSTTHPHATMHPDLIRDLLNRWRGLLFEKLDVIGIVHRVPNLPSAIPPVILSNARQDTRVAMLLEEIYRYDLEKEFASTLLNYQGNVYRRIFASFLRQYSDQQPLAN